MTPQLPTVARRKPGVESYARESNAIIRVDLPVEGAERCRWRTWKRYNGAEVGVRMIRGQRLNLTDSEPHAFAGLVQRLGQTFFVRDVMVKLDQMVYVASGDRVRAMDIVERERFSAVPVSYDGQRFESVFCTQHPPNIARTITEERPITVEDYIPDSTPLAEAFPLFEAREWYLTLRANRVSGLVTYWAFNSHEFRVQVYLGLSRVEELSRNVLAKDGCGVSDHKGLSLSPEVLDKVTKRFKSSQRELGGNRFVDALDFHHVSAALKKHKYWRELLNLRLDEGLSNGEYDRRYDFTELRDAVMHGRVLFPTYSCFQEGVKTVSRIAELIKHLEAYLVPPAGELAADPVARIHMESG